MTGFGRAATIAAGRKITVEIKALNSKQLDLIVKLPFRYRCLEGEVRDLVATRADRGKIEILATYESTGVPEAGLLNVELLRSYKQQIEEMSAAIGIPVPHDWHMVLMRMPDVMKGEDLEIGNDEHDGFLQAVEQAVDSMNSFRREEGHKLYDFFVAKIENIRSLLGEVDPHEESRVAKIRCRLQDQLEKLQGIEYDRGRLEQELIYYIEKLDITEEKQRLGAHLDYFLKTMGPKDAAPQAVGKKLGFISQEMGREINTLGSKSNNAEMQIIVVKMKDELEQIKEQVLNVL